MMITSMHIIRRFRDVWTEISSGKSARKKLTHGLVQ